MVEINALGLLCAVLTAYGNSYLAVILMRLYAFRVMISAGM